MKPNRTNSQIKKTKKNTTLSSPLIEHNSASTKKTNIKNVFNNKIKHSINIMKARVNRYSDENHLNSTREPKNETVYKQQIIDLINNNDAKENFLEFDYKTPSILTQTKKHSDITILEEFKKENFKNLSICNISSYLNYDLGKSFTSDSGLSGSDEDFKDNLSYGFETESYGYIISEELSRITGRSMPNQKGGVLSVCNFKEISILTPNDLCIFEKLNTSRDSYSYSDTDEVNCN
jgi:hypothetical protein